MKSGHGQRFLLGRLVTFPLACTALLTGWPAASQRSESDEPDDVRSCIDLMQIDHTRVADDDTIISEFDLLGTNLGAFMGGAPTGKAFRVPVVAVFFFDGDKITNERVYLDLASMLTQIGRTDLFALLG